DGKADILWRDYIGGENSVWLMDGTTARQFHPIPPVADLNWELAGSGDFDGDGRLDLLWRHPGSGGDSIWFRTGPDSFDFRTIRALSDQDWQVGAVGDFNRDGKDDIVWRNDATGDNTVWITDSPTRRPNPLRSAAREWRLTGAGDFDGD